MKPCWSRRPYDVTGRSLHAVGNQVRPGHVERCTQICLVTSTQADWTATTEPESSKHHSDSFAPARLGLSGRDSGCRSKLFAAVIHTPRTAFCWGLGVGQGCRKSTQHAALGTGNTSSHRR